MTTEQQKLLDEQKRIEEEFTKKMNELSEKVTNCDKPKMFPQEDERYWHYDEHFKIRPATASDSDGRLHAYKTEQEAKKARDIQWAKQRVAHAIAIRNDGWIPDWDDYKEEKHFVYLVRSKLCTDYWTETKYQSDYMYCKTEEIADQIAAEHKEDLLLIFSE